MFRCDLFSAFYFRRQPGEAEPVLMPQCTDPQEEGKCVFVWRRKLYVSFQCDSVFVCEGEESGSGRERERGGSGHVAIISYHISELVLPFFVAFPSPRSL